MVVNNMPTIEEIHKNTERVIESAGVSEKQEFRYYDGSWLPAGTPYHIHYTLDKQEYFMTGEVHSNKTRLVRRVKYQGMLAQYREARTGALIAEKYYTEYKPEPKAIDYTTGYFYRYFAKQANNKNAPIKEISYKDYVATNSFYTKISVKWRLMAPVREEIIDSNTASILRAEEEMEFITTKVMNMIEFYREPPTPSEKLNMKLQRRTTTSTPSSGVSGTVTGTGGGY